MAARRCGERRRQAGRNFGAFESAHAERRRAFVHLCLGVLWVPLSDQLLAVVQVGCATLEVTECGWVGEVQELLPELMSGLARKGCCEAERP